MAEWQGWLIIKGQKENYRKQWTLQLWQSEILQWNSKTICSNKSLMVDSGDCNVVMHVTSRCFLTTRRNYDANPKRILNLVQHTVSTFRLGSRVTSNVAASPLEPVFSVAFTTTKPPAKMFIIIAFISCFSLIALFLKTKEGRK